MIAQENAGNDLLFVKYLQLEDADLNPPLGSLAAD
jgi:hypothetical protein